MNEKLNDLFDGLSTEEKNVLVTKYLKSLSRWDLKRVLCNVLNVESYMDDDGLRKAFNEIVNER